MTDGMTEGQKQAMEPLWRLGRRLVTLVFAVWLLNQLGAWDAETRSHAAQVLVLAVVVWLLADLGRLAINNAGVAFVLWTNKGWVLWREWRQKRAAA